MPKNLAPDDLSHIGNGGLLPECRRHSRRPCPSDRGVQLTAPLDTGPGMPQPLTWRGRRLSRGRAVSATHRVLEGPDGPRPGPMTYSGQVGHGSGRVRLALGVGVVGSQDASALLLFALVVAAMVAVPAWWTRKPPRGVQRPDRIPGQPAHYHYCEACDQQWRHDRAHCVAHWASPCQACAVPANDERSARANSPW